MAKPEKKRHDDSWLDNVLDVISKPIARMNFYISYNSDKTTVTIEYDDLRVTETITDEYIDCKKAPAFYDSFSSFICEIRNVDLEVCKTNVPYFFSEVLNDHRNNASRMRELLNERNITLIYTERPQKTYKKGSK